MLGIKNTFVINVNLAKRNMCLDLANRREDPHSWFVKACKQHKSLQKKVMKAIDSFHFAPRKARLYNQIRKRLDRFRLDLPIGIATTRAINRLQSLHGKIKPAAHGVLIRTLLNGWPTHRRMRSHNSSNLNATCPFCSSGSDSIEHFGHCLWCRDVFNKFNVPCTSPTYDADSS